MKSAQAEEAAQKSITASAHENQVEGTAWIVQQPRSNYTVQLMVAATPHHLAAYARKELLTGPLAIAGFRRSTQEFYLLLQGSYATRDEAAVAAAQFESAKGLRPWVRSFAALPELFDSVSVSVAAKPEPVTETPVTGAAWLWSRNPLRYTLQLMGDSRSEPLRAYVNRYRPAGPLAIVRVKHEGKWWYLLLGGDYATAEEARQAMEALPSKLGSAHPAPRRFAALQDQLVAANH